MSTNIVCKKCKISKPISDFSISKKNKNGIFSWCKDCVINANKLNGKKKYDTDEEYKEYMKNKATIYYYQNKEKILARKKEERRLLKTINTPE